MLRSFFIHVQCSIVSCNIVFVPYSSILSDTAIGINVVSVFLTKIPFFVCKSIKWKISFSCRLPVTICHTKSLCLHKKMVQMIDKKIMFSFQLILIFIPHAECRFELKLHAAIILTFACEKKPFSIFNIFNRCDNCNILYVQCTVYMYAASNRITSRTYLPNAYRARDMNSIQ